MKNTMGYSLNAFLDHATPVAILSHLMIGSEGTLGFIAEAVLRTVPDYPLKHTGMLFFPDVPGGLRGHRAPARVGGPRPGADGPRVAGRGRGPTRGARTASPGCPRPPPRCCVEYQESTESELDRAAGRVPRPAARRSRCIGADLHPRPGAAGGPVGGAQGPDPVGGREAAARHLDDHRGRGLPPRGAGRRGARAAGDVRRAPLRRRHRLRPRQGREPPLRPQPALRRPRGRPGLRRLHARAGRPRGGPLRRGPQGRAQHRAQHGPVPGARVGPRGRGGHATS